MAEKDEMWRIFVAIPLPVPIKEALSAWCGDYKNRLAFSKWVYPEDYHITVQFLGDTPPDRIEKIRDGLSEAAAGIRPFSLEFRNCGHFGRPSAPRVLWAGVEGDLEPLRELQNRVVVANKQLGYIPEDRSYNPHITLARKYKEGGRFDPAILKEKVPEFGAWTVDAMVIYRTRMRMTPMYEEVARIALQG
ncbi:MULTISPECIES: RNA 2',3'-cyclic phosphodiesterase [Paenibacillus]|uniref:RNA 2',3'-cyclic phosphodiesterase n=1 Tax=Paenibacillus TaxID=44249 RepID=UPI002FE21EE6